MAAKLKLSLLILWIISLNTAKTYGQSYPELIFNFNYSFTACTANSVTITISFDGHADSNTFPAPNGGGTLTVLGFSNDSGPVQVTASSSCVNISKIVQVNFSGEGDCIQQIGFSSNGLNGSIKYVPELKLKAFANECGGATLSVMCPVSNISYTWQVNDENLSGWHTITGKSTQTIYVTREDLYFPGFSGGLYGSRIVRVIDPLYTNRVSDAKDLTFYAPGPDLSISSSNEPTCHGSDDGNIKINISSLVNYITHFTVNWDIKGSDGKYHPLGEHEASGSGYNITSLTAGKYLITVINNDQTDKYGVCSNSISATLNEPDKVAIQATTISPVMCRGGSDGKITVAASGGSGSGYVYTWSQNPSLKSNIATNLSAGTYTVSAIDSRGCTADAISPVVTQPSHAVSVSLSNKDYRGFGVRCAVSSDGEITAISRYTTGAVDYLWSKDGQPFGSDEADITGLTGGTYQVEIADDNHCMAISKSLTISPPPPIDFTLEETTTLTCAGGTDAIIETSITSGSITGVPLYHWLPGNEDTPSLVGVGAGNYTVQISDSEGCSTTKSIEISDPPVPLVTIKPLSDYHGSLIRCHAEESGSIAADVHEDEDPDLVPDDYTWFMNGGLYADGASQASLTDIGAGTYSLKIKYNGVCQVASPDFVLNEPDPVYLVVSATSNYHGKQISCTGASDGSIEVQASGGTGSSYTYLWDTGSIGNELSDAPAGTYNVTASDINGCQGTLQTRLADPEPVDVSITVVSDFNGVPISCSGSNDGRLLASASGGAGSFSYEWDDGTKGPNLTNLGKGNYSVSAIDINGCVANTGKELDEPSKITATVLSTSDFNGFGVSCFDAEDGSIEITGSGGTGNLSYAWQGRIDTTPALQNLESGTYTAVISDQNGCTAQKKIVLTEPAPTALSIADQTNVSCFGGLDGMIKLSGTGGTEDLTFSVDDKPWQLSPTFEELEAGKPYQFRVQDSNGCEASITTSLSSPSPIMITFAGIEPALCSKAIGSATGVASGGAGGYSYLWTDQASGQHVGSTASASDLMAGLYVLYVNDQNHCFDSASVAITSTDGPVLTIADKKDARCFDSNDGSASIDVSGGLQPYSYAWSDGSTKSTAYELKRGNYQVAVTDANHCTVATSVSIDSPPQLRDSLISSVSPKCNGYSDGSITVAASGGTAPYIYDWGQMSGPNVESLPAGNYTVQIHDAQGCEQDDSFELSEPDSISIKLKEAEEPTCSGDSNGKLAINASGGAGGYQYTWDNGSTKATLDSVAAGLYIVTVTDANNCSSQVAYNLPEPSPLQVDLGGSVTLCTGQSYLLDAGMNWQHYQWGSTTGISSDSAHIVVDQAGEYWVEVENALGCSARDTLRLETSNDLLQASFLIPDQAYVRDTVVMIDISWPVPERVEWQFPEEMDTIFDLNDIVFGRFDEPGDYKVNLTAHLGECVDEVGKFISIIDTVRLADDGRLGYHAALKEFTISPNPNDGRFSADIELAEEGPIEMTLWSSPEVLLVAHHDDQGASKYHFDFNIPFLPAGTYILRLDYRGGAAYKRVLIE